MHGPSDPSVRPPVRAGQFYPADPRQCRSAAESFVQGRPAGADKAWRGGVIPHAGWMFSGAIAGRTISAIAAAAGQVDVVVVFGAIHTPVRLDVAALDSHARWSVPSGESQVHVDAARRLQEDRARFVVDDRLHAREHAIEVNVPLLQAAFPGVPILPAEVPPLPIAPDIGRATAQALQAAGLSAVYFASSDLTHYGPDYEFMPAGVGDFAMAWAKDNDRPLLDLIVQGQAERVVPEVHQRYNACGAGAIAAMLAACRVHGAASGKVLQHATSYEVLQSLSRAQQPVASVGYAAIVVG